MRRRVSELAKESRCAPLSRLSAGRFSLAHLLSVRLAAAFHHDLSSAHPLLPPSIPPSAVSTSFN